MNKEGFTVFELLIGFTFLIIISYFLLTTILNIKDNQQVTLIRNKLIDLKTTITKEINNDIQKHYFKNITPCGENCITLNMADNVQKKLEIDITNNKIIYDNDDYELLKDSYFSPPFILESELVNSSFTARDNSILKIIIPIKHNSLKGNYGIRLIHSFNNSGPLSINNRYYKVKRKV